MSNQNFRPIKELSALDSMRKILVYVDNHPNSLRLLLAGQAQAEALGLPWEVLHIQSAQLTASHEYYDGYLINTLKRAAQMGAKIIQRTANSTYDGIVQYLYECARKGESFGAIVIGSVKKKFWRNWWKVDLAQQIRRVKFKFAVVEVIDLGAPLPSSRGRISSIFDFNAHHLLLTVLAVLLATITIELITWGIPDVVSSHNRNKVIIYMTACAFAAGRLGIFPGILAAILSFSALNILYVSPYMKLAITSIVDVVNLGLFLLSTVFIALFMSRTRMQREFFAARANLLQALFQLHRATLTEQTQPDLLKALHHELSSKLDGTVVFFLPDKINPQHLTVAYPDNIELSAAENEALELCWLESKTTGLGSYFNHKLSWRFEPLHTPNSQVGVLGIKLNMRGAPHMALKQLLNAICDQLALIIEHFNLDERIAESHMREDREKLRAMLLSSVSHDLKTPLASVIGSLSVYRSMGSRLPLEQQTTLIDTAIEEAQRLDNFITNILDMTRIESGDIDFKKEWYYPADMVNNVLKRLRSRLSQHILDVNLFQENIQICADAMMSEQVLQNVLDNAVKYTAKETIIHISNQITEDGFAIKIHDHGKGIPIDNVERVFDKYARLHRKDSQVAGTGLGLAIAKAIMQAQDGEITAANHADGGAVFTLNFRKWRNAIVEAKVV